MNCPKCGAEVSLGGAKFCQECGYTLSQNVGQAEEAVTMQAEAGVQQTPIAQSTPVAPSITTPQPSVQQTPTTTATAAINPRDSVYSIGGFLGTLLLMLIPIANIILLIVWAVSGTVNRNKKNLAIAYLILFAIGIIISIVFSASLAALFAGAFSDLLY